MKKLILAIALALFAISVFAGNPQICETKPVYTQQYGWVNAQVCNDIPPPAQTTIIYSTPPQPQVVYVEPRRDPWIVPFAAGVTTAVILGGHPYAHHHHWH